MGKCIQGEGNLVWVRVTGFNKYEINEFGEIRTAKKLRTRKRHHPVRGCCDGQGYIRAKLTNDDGDKETVLVHRLVCAAFHGGPPTEGHEVAHNNGIRNDNRASNLRWATRKENHADMQIHGTSVKGHRNGRARLSNRDVTLCRQLFAKGESISSLARKYDMSHSAMSSVVHRRTWQHVGA